MKTLLLNNLKTIWHSVLLILLIGVIIYGIMTVQINITQNQYQTQDQSQHQSQNTIILNGKPSNLIFKIAKVKRIRSNPNASIFESRKYKLDPPLAIFVNKPLGITFMTVMSQPYNGYYVGYWDFKVSKK